MTGKTNILTDVMNDQSSNVYLKIWSNSGDIFQENFPIYQTKFSHVKYSAMKCLFKENYFDEMDNYKLISIDSKRVIDEEKTLSEERVQNGGLSVREVRKSFELVIYLDEFLLTTKTFNQSSRIAQVENICLLFEKI